MPASHNIKSLTVLMAAHNAMPWLTFAIDSIMGQTFERFELLVLDDGSSDDTASYLSTITDPRLRVIRQENRGLVATLNRGLAEARHDWVARMDADDVALPERLERQVSFLNNNPQYSLVGCSNGYIGTAGRPIKARSVPKLQTAPDFNPNIDTNIVHAGVLYDRRVVKLVGGYRPLVPAEDLDLWLRMYPHCRMACIPDMLLLVRVLDHGMTSRNFVRQRVTWRYVHACAESRVMGLPEPRIDEFVARHWPRGIDRIRVEAARRIRMGGTAWANGWWLKAAFNLALAGALDPTELLKKLKQYF